MAVRDVREEARRAAAIASANITARKHYTVPVDGHCEECGGLTPLKCGDCLLMGPTHVPPRPNVHVFVCSATACRNAHEAEAKCTPVPDDAPWTFSRKP